MKKGQTNSGSFKKGHIPWHKGTKGVMPATFKGKKHKASSIEKLRKARTGKKASEETRRKMSEQRKGEKHHMFGKHHSAKTRKKFSEAWKKRRQTPVSEKTRKKLSLAHKGQKAWNKDKTGIFSEEIRRKMSEDRKGSKHPLFGKKHKASSIEKMRKATLHQPPTTKDTKPEKILQKLLKSKGIKFEKHKSIFGRPDLFIEPKTCIFVDGDYYHANKNDYKRNGKIELGFRNRPNKILRGKFRAKDKWQRDSKVNQTLRKEGYAVLRFWQSELDYKPEKCFQKIIKIIKESRR